MKNNRNHTSLYPVSGIQTLNWHHQNNINKGLSLFQQPEILQTDLTILHPQIEAFDKAYKSLIERHESLRTNFICNDGAIYQRVDDYCPSKYGLKVYDLQDKQEQHTIVEQIVSSHLDTLTDLRNGPLVAGIIFNLMPEKSYFVFLAQHIVCDSQSLQVAKRDLAAFYYAYKQNSPNPLKPLRRQLKDHIWLTEYKDDKVGVRNHNYWKNRLKDLKFLNLNSFYRLYGERFPKDHLIGRISLSNFTNDTPRLGSSVYVTTIDAKFIEKLELSFSGLHSSMFIRLVTNLYVLLSFLNNESDIVVATSVSNRILAGSENLIGHLVSKIYLRVHADSSITYRDLLSKVYTDFIRASRTPLYNENDIRDLNVQRRCFGYVNFTVSESAVRGVVPKSDHSAASHSCYALSIRIEQIKQGLIFAVQYNNDLFTPGMIEYMLETYKKLPDFMASYGDCTLAELKAKLLNEMYEDCTKPLD